MNITENTLKPMVKEGGLIVSKEELIEINELIEKDPFFTVQIKNGQYRLRLEHLFNHEKLQARLIFLYFYLKIKNHAISCIASRPAHGKTTMMAQFAFELSLKNIPVLYITEEPLYHLVNKIKNFYSEEEIRNNQQIKAIEMFSENKTVLEKIINETKPKFVFIDAYTTNFKRRTLEELAEKYDIRFIISKNLNRTIELRKDKIPQINDIYQKEKFPLTILMYRDSVYNMNGDNKIEFYMYENSREPIVLEREYWF